MTPRKKISPEYLGTGLKNLSSRRSAHASAENGTLSVPPSGQKGWSAVYLSGPLHASGVVPSLGYAFSLAMVIVRLSGNRLLTRFRPSRLLFTWASLPVALGLLPLLITFIVAGTLSSRALRDRQPEARAQRVAAR